MKAVRRLIQRLRFALFARRGDSAMTEELESHIQMQTDDYIRAGMHPQEARRLAILKFGSVESTKESYRDQRSLPIVESTVQDLRYAVRGIRKNPGFAIVAILSLAIGIGANTAIFSLVNSVLLRPLNFKDPERVFIAGEMGLEGNRSTLVNPVHAREWGKQCPSLEGVALMQTDDAQIFAGGEPANVLVAEVSQNLFTLFGIEPVLGRTFLDEEEQEGAASVAILSESIWRSRFNADPAIVGNSIVLDGGNVQVVGVIPGWFRLPTPGLRATAAKFRFEIFRPLIISKEESVRTTGNYNYVAAVRVRSGATPAQALAEMNVVVARFNPNTKAGIIPVQEIVTGRAQLGLWILAAAVGAVLLIVCVNLANLLLSRIASRGREAAIRTALGASRGRQFRQVLTENLVLAGSGGVLGIVFAALTVRLLVAASSLDIPRLDEVRLDLTVLLFASAVTLFTGLLFGTLPAWRLTRNDPQHALRAGSHTVTEGRHGLRLREALISLEVGLCTTLLIVSALLGTSLTRLLQVDKGFDAAQVLTGDIDLAGNLYTEPANREKFFDRMLAEIQAMPGVSAAGIITLLPTLGESWNDPIYLEGATRREERYSVNNRYASPEYFQAMNIAIRQGRAFNESDRGRHVAVLSEKAVRLLWPGEPNPIGLTFMGEDDKIKTLVGIVDDVRAYLNSAPPATAYYPYWQRVPGDVALVVRTTADARATVADLTALLRRQDSQQVVPPIRPMEEVVDESLAQRRFQASLMGVFAGSALLVAGLGIYGVVSYSVARRRNEIGVRMALGAQRSRLLRMVIRQGMTPVAIGLAAGVALAYFIGGAIRGLLFGVESTDPLTIVTVTLVLIVVGILACLIPARRAVGIDVVSALRFE